MKGKQKNPFPPISFLARGIFFGPSPTTTIWEIVYCGRDNKCNHQTSSLLRLIAGELSYPREECSHSFFRVCCDEWLSSWFVNYKWRKRKKTRLENIIYLIKTSGLDSFSWCIFHESWLWPNCQHNSSCNLKTVNWKQLNFNLSWVIPCPLTLCTSTVALKNTLRIMGKSNDFFQQRVTFVGVETKVTSVYQERVI